MTTLSMDQLQLNTSPSSSTEAIGFSYEAKNPLPEKCKNSEEENETMNNFFNAISTDVPNYCDLFKSVGLKSSLSMFDENETFPKNSSFSAVTYDANVDGLKIYDERDLWLDNDLNHALNARGSELARPKKENFSDIVNIYKNNFDYSFLEDSFCTKFTNRNTVIANENLDEKNLLGRPNMETSVMGSHYSEPGGFMGSNSRSEEFLSTSFDIKEENLTTIKEELISPFYDVKDENSETMKECSIDNDVTNLMDDQYDETLDPDLEAAMQRCMKITKILTSGETSKKSISGHKNIVRRNNSFAFLRPALKRRFLVPPKSPADQPMISMKSVHYKWPDKSRETHCSRIETIHFAMYAAIKKKYLKETQKVIPSFRKCKETNDSKSRLRGCPITKEASKINKDTTHSMTATLTSVCGVKDEKVSPLCEKDSSAAKDLNSKNEYSIDDIGWKITVPSSVSVDICSFSSDKFQANPEISIITPISEANQPDYLIESTINSINSDLNNFKNGTISKYAPLKGKIGKKSNSLKMRRKSVLNTKNVVKIQIYTRSPKRMVVTRVKEPNATDDSNDTTSGFQLIKSILSHLNDLSSDLVKQICLPLKALQRGTLTESEINCIVRQGNLLKTLSELTNNHKGCSLIECSMCEIIRAKKTELHRLMNWSHQTDFESQQEVRNEGTKRKIDNHSAFEKFNSNFWRKSKNVNYNGNSENISKFPNESTKPSTKSEQNEIGKLCSKVEAGNKSILKNEEFDSHSGERKIKDSPTSILEFKLERLDIGKFSLMSSEIDDVIKVFCNSESIVYEIDLQNSKVQPVTLAIIRIACKDIIGVNLIHNVITVEFKTIPVLCLYDPNKQHEIPMEKVVSKNPASLLASLKKQFNVYFLHKLFVKENIEFALKNFVLNFCPQAKLTSNTEDDILQKSYYDGKYLLYDQREKRQKHLERLLHGIEEFINVKGAGKKENQSCCECVNGCRSPLDCWCCRKGNPCLNCCCLSCTNPLNVLHLASVNVQEAKMDVCLMQNIYDLQDMKLRDILRQEHILTCCGASMTTKQLIPNIKECNECRAPLSFSWCTQVVFHEENKQRNHCILCMQCQPLLYLHCCNCSTCTLASTTGKCTQCM